MLRYSTGIVALLLAGAPVLAGELDAEFKGKVARPAAALTGGLALPAHVASATLSPSQGQDLLALSTASELDREDPAQAWRCGFRGGWGGWGYGGWGWGGWGCGWRSYSWCAPVYSCYYPVYSWGYCAYPRWGWCW